MQLSTTSMNFNELPRELQVAVFCYVCKTTNKLVRVQKSALQGMPLSVGGGKLYTLQNLATKLKTALKKNQLLEPVGQPSVSPPPSNLWTRTPHSCHTSGQHDLIDSGSCHRRGHGGLRKKRSLLSANSLQRANQTPWDGPHTGSLSR